MYVYCLPFFLVLNPPCVLISISELPVNGDRCLLGNFQPQNLLLP